MGSRETADRQRAMRRHAKGESPSSVYGSLGYSARWFFKWLRRYRSGNDQWFRKRSRRPHTQPQRTAPDLETLVTQVRRNLSARDLFCGSQAIQWDLDTLEVA